jgi:hypothetical protein
MKLEIYQYWPTGKGVTIEDLKGALPAQLRRELLDGPKFLETLSIERSKREAVAQLDKQLGVGTRGVVKQPYLETQLVDRNGYSHFVIRPQQLERGKDFEVTITPPRCMTRPDFCPWGSRMLTPLTVNMNVISGLGIAELWRQWGLSEVDLLVSVDTKDLFDREGITGLEYKQCQYRTQAGPSTTPSLVYHARLTQEGRENGMDIIVGDNFCTEHNIIYDPIVFGRYLKRSNIPNTDFVRITTLTVGKTDYHFYKPMWLISRKCLDVMLSNKVAGLEYAGWFFDELFRPVEVQ